MPVTPPDAGHKVPGQRRPHKKSRSGCQQCKQKKIKCDERKPSCSHCRRLQSTCTYPSTISTSSTATNATIGGPLLSPHQPNIRGGSRSTSTISDGPSVVAQSGLSLEVGNLELLHFYTTTTSFTLSNRTELQQIWQQVVPQIAFTHDFLLHGILALSALHLALSQPERKALLQGEASAHHELGLSKFRIAMSNITPENCDACLAFSTLIAAYAWASSNQAADLFFSDTSTFEEDSQIEWASLLRGVYILLNATFEWMGTSLLKPILFPRPEDPTPPNAEDPVIRDKLTELSQLWVQSPGKFTEVEIQAFNDTVALLQDNCSLVASFSDDRQVDIVTIIYAWPIKVPEVFLSMVKEFRPEALIILAHYSLLLNKAEHVWFVQGMSRRLLQTIHSKIGKEWEGWITWLLQNLVLTEFKQHGAGKSLSSPLGGGFSGL
ncbi:hypothetical protein BT63DRAFT_243480 [Microthyrium microscopicum]|uniref:Zn(2)-C6 fungal-type domain-containing protein n=1 Tax=Microthyrium microscopicum TaxID=703497 RepID=A0A6A6UIC5_9PEZI|nr:hypothetical protein BT63DRAFT_243480 [Microthyrium microscopicum]